MSQRDRTEGRHVTASGRERAAGEKRQIRIVHGSRQLCTDEATGSQSNTASPQDRRSRYLPRLDRSLDGGPQDPSLLISFEAHVANEIWSHRNKSEDRGRLKCHQRPTVIRDWPRPHYLDEPWVIVRESGLAHLSTSMHGHIDNPLLSAFVERWQPETNSFHMPWGEMTITLHDVWKILRLRIDGDPVVLQTSRNHQEEINELSTSLCIDYSRLREEMRRGSIKFKTLREAGRSRADGVMTTAAYLLYLLSATVFVDKSADRALDRFFPLLLNYDEIQNYAWGTTVLAYLYRRLGEASRSECRQLSGCTTLLQSWIYEYFPLLRPARAMRYRSGEPRSLRWKTDFTPNQDDEALFDYRIALDRMTAHQVEWMPYGPIDLTTSHLRVSRYHGPRTRRTRRGRMRMRRMRRMRMVMRRKMISCFI